MPNPAAAPASATVVTAPARGSHRGNGVPRAGGGGATTTGASLAAGTADGDVGAGDGAGATWTGGGGGAAAGAAGAGGAGSDAVAFGTSDESCRLCACSSFSCFSAISRFGPLGCSRRYAL